MKKNMTLAEGEVGIERDIALVTAQIPAAERGAVEAEGLILRIEEQLKANKDRNTQLEDMLRVQRLIASRPAKLRDYIERARGSIERSKAAQSANSTGEIGH